MWGSSLSVIVLAAWRSGPRREFKPHIAVAIGNLCVARLSGAERRFH